MYKRLSLLLTGLLALLFGGVFTASASQTMHFVVYDLTVACEPDEIRLKVFAANNTMGNLYYETIVYDDNHIYMAQYIQNDLSGFFEWEINNANQLGLQTEFLPSEFPKKSKLHILVTLRDANHVARAYSHVYVKNCHKGKYEVNQGLVQSITPNSGFETGLDQGATHWTITNSGISDARNCGLVYYAESCSLWVESSTDVKKKVLSDVFTDSIPGSTSGVRIEAWVYQGAALAKNAKLKGVVTHKGGAKQVIKVNVNTRATDEWVYYSSLPVTLQGEAMAVKTQIVIPVDTSANMNFFDNVAVLFYMQGRDFHATRNMPALPLPGTILPVANAR